MVGINLDFGNTVTEIEIKMKEDVIQVVQCLVVGDWE